MESRTLRSHRVVGAIADDAPACVSFYDLGGVGFVCARVAGDAFQVLKLDSLAVQLTSPRLQTIQQSWTTSLTRSTSLVLDLLDLASI